jgi:di/tricarboxylate transporter
MRLSESTVTFLVLGAAVVLFVCDVLPVAIVAIAVALALWATGVLELDQALAGFGDPTVLFIASLFVVGEALQVAGVTAWLARELVDRAGASRRRT